MHLSVTACVLLVSLSLNNGENKFDFKSSIQSDNKNHSNGSHSDLIKAEIKKYLPECGGDGADDDNTDSSRYPRLGHNDRRYGNNQDDNYGRRGDDDEDNNGRYGQSSRGYNRRNYGDSDRQGQDSTRNNKGDSSNRNNGRGSSNRNYGRNNGEDSSSNRNYGSDSTSRNYGSDSYNRNYGQDSSRSYGQDSSRGYGQDSSRGYGQDSSKGYGQDSSRNNGQDSSRSYGGYDQSGSSNDDSRSYGRNYGSYGQNYDDYNNRNRETSRYGSSSRYPLSRDGYGYSGGYLRSKRSDNMECISQCVFGYIEVLDDNRSPSESALLKWIQDNMQNDAKRIKAIREARRCFARLVSSDTTDGCEFSKSLSNCMRLDIEN